MTRFMYQPFEVSSSDTRKIISVFAGTTTRETREQRRMFLKRHGARRQSVQTNNGTVPLITVVGWKSAADVGWPATSLSPRVLIQMLHQAGQTDSKNPGANLSGWRLGF